ncbi:unnamed protein product [Protopolystoma xenopodis]|uniref:Uncharacterized protein n=1 Tax=Protopolystoma xenopodis TaxID=117903 RepID=A0A448WPM5_9PLAT|nr:unnamed protein product [Protopolystoma xenopodis]
MTSAASRTGSAAVEPAVSPRVSGKKYTENEEEAWQAGQSSCTTGDVMKMSRLATGLGMAAQQPDCDRVSMYLTGDSRKLFGGTSEGEIVAWSQPFERVNVQSSVEDAGGEKSTETYLTSGLTGSDGVPGAAYEMDQKPSREGSVIPENLIKVSGG